jgi:lipoprotein-anchoring transpeptidase ErfK/SrfK
MTRLWNNLLAAASRVAKTAPGYRLMLGAAAAIAAGGVVTALVVLPGSAAQQAAPARFAAAPAAASLPSHAGTERVARPAPIPVRPGWTLIATLRTAVPRYARPGGRPEGTVAATWYGRPCSLPVIGQQPGWVRVRLATRPNGSTAWLRTTRLTFSQTPFLIVVDLAARRVRMLSAGHLVMNAPAGIGTGTDPTPAGQFFVAFYEQSPGAGYGPFILVTSAHSDAISDWEDSGDAIVGIHGPLGADIGRTGLAVSHGCIRLSVLDLVQLAGLPSGTPITITA